MKLLFENWRKYLKEALDDYMLDNLARLFFDKNHKNQAIQLLGSLSEEDRVRFLVNIQPWRELLPDNLKGEDAEKLIKMELTDVSRSTSGNAPPPIGTWSSPWSSPPTRRGLHIKRTYDILLNDQKIGSFIVDSDYSSAEILGYKAPVRLDWNKKHFDKKFKGYIIYNSRPHGKGNRKNNRIEEDGLMAFGGLMNFFNTKSGSKWFKTRKRKEALSQFKGTTK